MRAGEAREYFRQLSQKFFEKATVIFANQTRIAKPEKPLVTILTGNISRQDTINQGIEESGEVRNYYTAKMNITVDLFTNGLPVFINDKIVAYENSACDDLIAFCNYLHSEHTLEFCYKHDVTILIDSEVQDMTGIVNDTNYEYRARVMLSMYFTQSAIGFASVLTPMNESYETTKEGEVISETIVEEPLSMGGTSAELVSAETGYFTEAEIEAQSYKDEKEENQ